MEPTITIAGLVGMLALVKTFVDYLRSWASLFRHETGSGNMVTHRSIAYAAGILAVFLFGASQLGDFAVPGTSLLLSDMNGWTKLIVGLSIGGMASLYTDTIKAVDSSDSQRVPPMIQPTRSE